MESDSEGFVRRQGRGGQGRGWHPWGVAGSPRRQCAHPQAGPSARRHASGSEWGAGQMAAGRARREKELGLYPGGDEGRGGF